jgi:peptidoglycan/xylan/chitin deacetylase (PgdA/CDA1 family)
VSGVKHDRKARLLRRASRAKVVRVRILMLYLSAMIALLAVALTPSAAVAQPCPNPNALGIARVLEVDAASTPRVGLKSFPQTLPLQHKELVLTFDDGPIPETTPKVLDALKAECVRATFFMVGRNSKAYPALARRILADGHTVGHHTFSHPILSRLPAAMAEAEINRGFEEDDNAVYGHYRGEPIVPFFRFPGFASTPALLDMLARRRIVVFGADVWASDWNEMAPSTELNLILRRIETIDHGIVLFHDTRAQTVHMLPEFLRELKRRGYRIVYVVPAGSRAAF